MKKGIDISSWQGFIDFKQVKSSGVDFVIIRSGCSLTEDKKFKEYVSGARNSGIKIHGLYHFSYATDVTKAENEALFCVKLAESVGLPKSTVLYYDFEYDTVNNAAKKGITLGREEVNDFTTVFCEEVKRHGYRAGFYTNLDYYGRMYTFTTVSRYVDHLWIANYSSGTAQTYGCEMRQYSSTERIPGISGNVDCDYLYKEDDDMTDEEFLARFRKAMDVYQAESENAEPAKWSQKARDYCIEKGIFKGTKNPDGTISYSWKRLMTREEAAQLIYNQETFVEE